MKTIRRTLLMLAVIACCSPALIAQTPPGRVEVGGFYDEEKIPVELTDANWRMGLGFGPTIATDATLLEDLRANGRLYVRRQFNNLLQAEVGVGVNRMAGNYQTNDEYDTHFWTVDGRAMLAPAIDEHWNPYLSVGIGYAHYRLIDPANEELESGGRYQVREEGGDWMVPLALGVQFKPERHARFAFDLGVGYSVIFNEDFDGQAGGGYARTFSGILALEYLFHDQLEESRETASVE